ncbi:hypothetical protein V1478_010555 [Vespula squamosa]|uniref:Uncharacterized protein n=1 Tax=Vespula squamosa TaxID=30214 RepID=A0ABD2AI44_VESSQ
MSSWKGQRSRRADEERDQQIRTLTQLIQQTNLAQNNLGNIRENHKLGVSLDVGRYVDAGNNARSSANGLGFSVKPDNYDEKEQLKEFLAHFEFVVRTNNWNEPAKTMALASSLKGKMRSVLETIRNMTKLTFSELKTQLEIRFGKKYLCY